MTNTQKSKQDIQCIREDIDSLKSNIVQLTKHIKNDGGSQINHLKHIAEDRLENISEIGQEKYKDVRNTVQKNPEKSVAIAFATGLLASFLMGRR